MHKFEKQYLTQLIIINIIIVITIVIIVIVIVVLIIMIIIVIIIITMGVVSRPARGAPAYTEHRHSKFFDLWTLTKSIHGKN